MTTQIQTGIRVSVERWQWGDFGGPDHERRSDFRDCTQVWRDGEVIAIVPINERARAVVALDDGRIVEASLSALRRI